MERADTPHEICSRGHADKQTIAFNGARYGGLHEHHQISGDYAVTTAKCFCFLLRLGNQNNIW